MHRRSSESDEYQRIGNNTPPLNKRTLPRFREFLGVNKRTPQTFESQISRVNKRTPRDGGQVREVP